MGQATLRYWRAETAIFLFIWLLLMAVGRSRFFIDPGSLWHPVVGGIILDSGHLIHTDPFSFTRAGQPWIAQQWLGECILAVLHKLGGLDTILLATAVLLAALYTWIAHRLMARGLHPLLAILVMSLAGLSSSFHVHARPHLVNIAGVALTLAWLCDFEAGRKSLGRLFWLIPIYLVWTNIHGGVVGGMATLVLVVAGWSAAWLIGLESPIKRWSDVGALAGLALACVLTTFVNPYGLALPETWFGLIFSDVLPKLIMEHQPLIGSGVAFTVLAIAILYAAALIGVMPRVPRVTWLLPLVWFYLAWTRVRHGPLFGVVAAVALAELLPYIRWFHWLGRHGSVTCRLRPAAPASGPLMARLRPALIPFVLIAFALVLQIAGIRFPLIGSERARPSAEELPMELLPELQDLAKSGTAGNRIFNDMFYGGFLIYYTPELRLFIDDRCELYVDKDKKKEQLLEEYAHALNEDPAQLDAWQKEYGFELALVKTGTSFDQHLQASPDAWEVIGPKGPATLYRRKIK